MPSMRPSSRHRTPSTEVTKIGNSGYAISELRSAKKLTRPRLRTLGSRLRRLARGCRGLKRSMARCYQSSGARTGRTLKRATSSTQASNGDRTGACGPTPSRADGAGRCGPRRRRGRSPVASRGRYLSLDTCPDGRCVPFLPALCRCCCSSPSLAALPRLRRRLRRQRAHPLPAPPARQPVEHARRHLPLDPNSAVYIAHMAPAPDCTPTSARCGMARRSASPTLWCPATSPRCPSTSTTPTRATPARTRSRRTRRSRAPAAAPTATATCWCSTRTTSCSTSSTTRTETATSWHAGSGAVFDLTSNALRPDGWTSADAAGLPILPGLVRYDEAVGRRRDRPRAALHRRDDAARLHLPGDALTPATRPTRTCRRWGCACGSRRATTSAAFPAELRVILQALKTLRHDGGRQRRRLVRERRPRPALGRRGAAAPSAR